MPKFTNHIKLTHYINNIGILSSFIFILLTLSILIPINLKGEKTIAASGDTSTTSLTLSTTSGSAELDLLVTSDSGTFASSTAPLTFSASTNNYTGYTLSIKSATSSTNLTNSTKDANNNTVTAVFTSLSSTNATTKNGITAVTFNSSTYNNQWGFKPSYYDSTANSDKFYPSPDSTGITLNRTNCANGSSNGTYTCSNVSDSYTIEIGARATYAQVAGTYTNAYILSAVGNYPEYKITYHDASGESTDLPTTQEISSTDNETAKQTSISFSTTEPTRDGYEFIGWCSVNNSADPTSCSGTTYDPGDTYALDLLSSNIMPLYAIWEEDIKIYMQNLTSEECTTTAQKVYDNRDGAAYVVQRLADGKCWMLENLAFDAYAYRNEMTIANTNVDQASLNSFLNGGGSTSDRYATSGVAANWTSSYSYSQPMIAVSGSCSNTTNCVNQPSSGSWQNASIVKWAGTGEIADSSSTTGGKIGVYYNYCAASAGNYCFGNGVNQGTSSGSAEYDICPYNWRLPTGGNSGEFQALYAKYGTRADYVVALRLLYSGFFYSGKAQEQNVSGHFWASNWANNYSMYRLNINASSVVATNAYYRSYGYSVRCVLKENIADVKYLQDVTSNMASRMTVNDTATLTDKRDNQSYTVAKLADGKLWMTKNMNLAGGTKLYSDTSDVADGYPSTGGVAYYTLPASSVSGFNNHDTAYVYNSGSVVCGDNRSCYSYYSWLAATAGGKDTGGDAVVENGYNAAYSICPKGWKMPTATTSDASVSSSNNWKTGDWYMLAVAYGANVVNSPTNNSDSGFYTNMGPSTLANFLLSGLYDGSGTVPFVNGGSFGYCWSRTQSYSTFAYYMFFGSSRISVGANESRGNGFPVRCLFAGS